MAFQFSVEARNAALDAMEAAVGTSPLLRLYSGAVPATTATAASGTLLGSATLPADWLGAASGGVKTLLGTWSGTGSAGGTTGYFRILNNAGTLSHFQGTVTATGGGGDMTLDNVVIANAQVFNVSAYTLTAGGA